MIWLVIAGCIAVVVIIFGKSVLDSLPDAAPTFDEVINGKGNFYLRQDGRIRFVCRVSDRQRIGESVSIDGVSYLVEDFRPINGEEYSISLVTAEQQRLDVLTDEEGRLERHEYELQRALEELEPDLKKRRLEQELDEVQQKLVAVQKERERCRVLQLGCVKTEEL